MIHIEIDGKAMEVPQGKTIIEAADEAGIAIPRFCYHKKLSIAANCRMCLVEVENAPKALPACATPVAEGMKVFTVSEAAKTAQKDVMEFLLINHPLDCPICDQGGQCELQDMALEYGKDYSRYQEGKRVVQDKNLGPLISTDMTRCIHCTRCVRFGDEIAGQRELGVTGRGEHSEIGTYVSHTVASEMSGNVIDLCPVGALTSKPFRFLARAWELQARPSISAHEPIGANILYHTYQGKVIRTLPRDKEDLNEVWLSDRDRFGYEGFNHADRLTQPLIKQGNTWEVADWNTAMQVATEKLGEIFVREPEQVGALTSANATVEEMFLLQKLMRDMGSPHIDHRLRQTDTAHETAMGLYPKFGIPLGELEKQKTVFVVGSDIKKEQPLIAHRIRKATQQGAQVHLLNPAAFEVNFAAQHWVGTEGDFLTSVQSFVKALIAQKPNAIDLPKEMQQALNSVTVDEKTQSAVDALVQDQASVLLGDYALTHPNASSLYAWSYVLAQLLGATFGELTTGANTAGAWIAGAIPHRMPLGQKVATKGMSAQAMLEANLKAYVLLNCEPAYDCANPQLAHKALSQAACVVALSSFDCPALREVADVILPITPMSEMSGTYVNALGDWQTFEPAVHPLGDSKPAWKVLRVMGNLWELPGYNQESISSVTADLSQRYHEMTVPTISWPIPYAQAEQQTKTDGLRRLAPQSLYSVDPIVRRAASLQATPDAQVAQVKMASAQAAALQFKAGETVWVTQNSVRATTPLPVVCDDSIPMGVAVVASSLPQTISLGASYGAITLDSAEKGQ